jgi:hypothetical protein
MTTHLTATLTALLDHWNTTAAEAARKLEASEQPVQGGFYAGVMFGMETARDELAAALAIAMSEVAKP